MPRLRAGRRMEKSPLRAAISASSSGWRAAPATPPLARVESAAFAAVAAGCPLARRLPRVARLPASLRGFGAAALSTPSLYSVRGLAFSRPPSIPLPGRPAPVLPRTRAGYLAPTSSGETPVPTSTGTSMSSHGARAQLPEASPHALFDGGRDDANAPELDAR